MPRRSLLCRGVSVLAVAAGLSFAAPAAADPLKYLPDGTMLVLRLDVKQFLQSPAIRGDDKGFRKEMGELKKALEPFGIDPTKDVNQAVFAAGEQLKAANMVLLLVGQFDPAKVQGRLKDLARQRKDDLQEIDEGGATIFQGRMPRQAVPNPTFTPPERFYVTVLDEHTIGFAADRAALTDALAKRSGSRKPNLKPRVAELIAAAPKETLSVVFVPPAGFGGESAAGLTSITGGVTFADAIKTDLKLTTKDAAAAKKLAGDINDGLTRIKELLPGLAAFQPGVGPKEQAMIKDVLDTFKATAAGDAVTLTSTISRELFEKNARKDQ